MAIEGTKGNIGRVDISQPSATDQGVSGTTPSSSPASTRDVRADAANLNRIAQNNNVFRPGSILARNVGSTTSAERALPGGSVSAALGRAEEFGDIADAAAARVVANHPEIFGA